MNVTARRQSTTAPTAAWTVAVVLAAGALVLIIFAGTNWLPVTRFNGLPGAISRLYATLGALIVHRAGNTIGWYLLIAGIADGLVALASAYAVLGIRHPGALPGPRSWAFWPSGLSFR